MMSSLLHVSFVHRTSAPPRVHRCNHRQYSTIYDAITGEVCTSVLFIILCILRFVKDGETALFTAAYYGKTAIITELVEKGADPNVPNKVRLYKSCSYILLLISREKG